jgi:hypothetical protein
VGKRLKVTPEYLCRRLSCDFDSGNLIWKKAMASDFPKGKYPPERICAQWNNRLAGKPALTALSLGYRVGNVGGNMLKAHRVIWAMYYGEWPNGEIDHINGNPQDNRISNLRLCKNGENQRNMAKWRGKDLPIGVSKHREKFRAYIRPNKKQIHLGLFDTPEAASAAVKQAHKKYGFHENHGRPCRDE